ARDRDGTFTRARFRRAGELGLLGVTIPEEYGGAGLDAVAAVEVCEALSTSDPGFAPSVLAHAVLFAQNVAVNGTELQKKHILPRAVAGEWLCGLCMTEPEVGTDVLSLKTTARRDGDVFRLTGRKTFITNGGADAHTLGDCFIVYAATEPKKLSSFLVEKGMPGFSLGQKWKDKLGMRASFTSELVFDDVPVPITNRMGEEGEGTLHMMRNLEIERLTLAAMSLGIAQRCLQVMVDYANQRKAFGQPLHEFGQIQRYVAESFAEWRSARTFVYDVARRLDLRGSGQSRGVADGEAAGRRRRAGARRLRLHGRVRRRTPVARREAPRDRRRHARGAPEEPVARAGARSVDPAGLAVRASLAALAAVAV